jgi:hypothetical protein
MDMVGKSFVQDRKMVRNGLLKPEIGLQVEEMLNNWRSEQAHRLNCSGGTRQRQVYHQNRSHRVYNL